MPPVGNFTENSQSTLAACVCVYEITQREPHARWQPYRATRVARWKHHYRKEITSLSCSQVPPECRKSGIEWRHGNEAAEGSVCGSRCLEFKLMWVTALYMPHLMEASPLLLLFFLEATYACTHTHIQVYSMYNPMPHHVSTSVATTTCTCRYAKV